MLLKGWQNMHCKLALAITILPGTALILIPSFVLCSFKDSEFSAEFVSPYQSLFWLGLSLVFIGLSLALWTVRLFMKYGKGTPFPWEPPKKLVIRGPYRHVRNPMISSMLLIIMAEALLFQSWPLTIWMVIFFAGNAVYLPLIEEKSLEKKFGEEYRMYKKHVPRWIPRLRSWPE
ncbi:MAG: isoprenylcysteine carboxylmethyltransferase family protein [Thermodesulfobacteriota bacterium]|nr:isoprenylcysteine carboxylmethyltransferase family protein [Thermodesulfobacteriota bacterium]